MTNAMSCGCEIISDNLGAYKIEYCPKHKAADDMYEALELVDRAWAGDGVDMAYAVDVVLLAKARAEEK